MENTLFTLLQLGLENKTPTKQALDEISVLTREDWRRLRQLSEMQGVAAIVLDGIKKAKEASNNVDDALTQTLRLEWIGNALMIEQRNYQQQAIMNELAQKWIQKGCRVMVMKGLATGVFYPNPAHRNPGDIDCYLFDNYARGNEIAGQEGANVDESWYKHSIINYKGEIFENHQYFVHTRDGKRGKRLNQELIEQLKEKSEEIKVIPGTEVEIPPVQWTAMFLTYHACAHFISEGLRLKQILDWAMFLKAHQKDVDWVTFYAYCDRNHLKCFADAMTVIAMRYLGVKRLTPDVVCESPFADKILQSALYDEDYVFGSGKSNWYNRYHLIRNMFHYRWKYEEIYQTNIWKQLWWYATGFLFKTE